MNDELVKGQLTEYDAFWLTVWAEGRGEPLEGQVAIACTIRNRVKTPGRFGASYRAVCLRPKQFSCWNAGTDRNHVRLISLAQTIVDDYAIRSTLPADPVMDQVRFVCEGVMNGKLLDNVRGADHYLTLQLFTAKPPSWAKGQHPVAYKGAHAFLRLG